MGDNKRLTVAWVSGRVSELSNGWEWVSAEVCYETFTRWRVFLWKAPAERLEILTDNDRNIRFDLRSRLGVANVTMGLFTLLILRCIAFIDLQHALCILCRPYCWGFRKAGRQRKARKETEIPRLKEEKLGQTLSNWDLGKHTENRQADRKESVWQTEKQTASITRRQTNVETETYILLGQKISHIQTE